MKNTLRQQFNQQQQDISNLISKSPVKQALAGAGTAGDEGADNDEDGTDGTAKK